MALGANLLIAIAKLGAGLLTLSSSMLAEAAHSIADTLNEVFLLTSLKKADQPADATHPFGYGKERFFWALLAAVGIFVSGSGFSILYGVYSLLQGSSSGDEDFLINYVVLGVAFLAEGTSLAKAVHQVRGQAKEAGRGLLEHLRRSPDPTVKLVASEDSAAVVGLLLAGLGNALHQVTGNAYWDGAASIAIGLLLAYVAYAVGRDTKDLLIGESADPQLRLEIVSALLTYDEVDAVPELLTMLLGPDALLVAARLDLHPGLDSDAIEDFSTRVETDLAARFPTVKQVFLDATRATSSQQVHVVATVQAEREVRATTAQR